MALYVVFFFQLIFRKVSDVKKEKELAEKRKNDPALNHTQDHLVRKLFSKFKKVPEITATAPGTGNTNTTTRDLERGDADGGPSPSSTANNGVNRLTAAAAATPTDDDTAVTTTSSTTTAASSTTITSTALKRPGGGASMWGRFRASAAAASTSTSAAGAMAASNDSSPASSTIGLTTSLSVQEPVRHVGSRRNSSTSIRNSPIKNVENDFFLHVQQHQAKQLEREMLREQELTSPMMQQRQQQPTAAEYTQIINNITEFKTDITDEIQSLNIKIVKMETLMSDFIAALNKTKMPTNDSSSAATTPIGEDTISANSKPRKRHKSKSRSCNKNASSSAPSSSRSTTCELTKMMEDEIEGQQQTTPKSSPTCHKQLSYLQGSKEEFL